MRRGPRGKGGPRGHGLRASAAAAAILLVLACQSRFQSFSFITAEGQEVGITERPGRRPDAEALFQPTAKSPDSPLYSLRRALTIPKDGQAFAISYTSSIPNTTLTLYSDSRTSLKEATLPPSTGTNLRFLVPLKRGDKIWGYRLSMGSPGSGHTGSLQLLGAGTSAYVHGFVVEEGDLAVDGSVAVLESSPRGISARLTSSTRQELSRGWWLISLEPAESTGAGQSAGSVRLEAADGTRAAFSVDPGFITETGQSRIDFAKGSIRFLPRDIAASFPVKSLRLSFVPADAPIPADPGTILTWDRSQWRRSDYEVFAWDRYPSVLIFDTASYAVQDDLFNRLAFFVEKAGYVGTIPDTSVLAGKHGYNAHDYRAEDLARFFQTAAENGIRLTPGETRLRDTLLSSGVIVTAGSGYSAGSGSVISISRESSPILRQLLLTHESFHGIFFSLPAYQRAVEQEWNALSPLERELWQEFLASRAYDASDHYLVIDEFQAYLFQQDRESVPGFQALTLSRLRATSRRAESLVAELQAQYPDSFLRSFDALESALRSLDGPPGGRTLRIRLEE